MLNGERRGEGLVAVAIDKEKTSQYALKWAADHLVSKGQSVMLLHVKMSDVNDNQAKEVFLPFRCFCTRKDIQCQEIIIEDADIAKALIDQVTACLIGTLVLGAPSRGGFVKRFKATDIPTTVSKAAPQFCTVYVIAKGKIASLRSATRPLPNFALVHNPTSNTPTFIPNPNDANFMYNNNNIARVIDRTPVQQCPTNEDIEIKSPFSRGRASYNKACGEVSVPDSDISFVSSGRPSTDRMFPSLNENLDSGTPSVSANNNHHDFLSTSQESGRSSASEDVEAEMRRLRLELKQTMDMYSSACKEALTAKHKARELHRWKMEEGQRLEEARLAEEAALALAEREKAKCRAAMEAAEASKRIAELESQKRLNAEMKAYKEAEERKKVLNSMQNTELRYRKYAIEEIEAATEFFTNSRKIGEGGYGPVYKCYLDHTPVAIKVLRPDAAQGRSQFHQEVEVLCCIRHPNMVLLLGACPEYGCLVYEYMANGSLDDRLFRRSNTPPIPWQLRFRIAAEIGTGLLFLHQTKPEPLVHRDLKPGNILLDRNYVSKISDVGLARLVPPSVANAVTQYRMTSTAGTFCYIDPEYQQTGMLGIKSDIYSFGILLLQLITAKPPMGLTHHVERAIERGTFAEILDPAITDWPVEEALIYAKLALQCAELRRKDRPDLGKVVLPELNRLRALSEDNMPNLMFCGQGASPNHSNSNSSPVSQ